MKEIHEKILQHLLENHPNLYFTLRKIDRGGKLRKGYWFIGNDNYLAFSFWQGEDWRNKTPNVIFVVSSNGATVVEFIDRDNGKKREFFAKIAKSFKMNPKRTKGDILPTKWFRSYSLPNETYIQAIDRFIENDRGLFDTLCELGEIKYFPSIDASTFKRTLSRIQQYRFKVGEITVSEVIEKSPLSIQRLKLTNISHFSSVNIDLSKRVICLIGENGSGKTTLLRTIVFGLIGFSNEHFVPEDINKFNNLLKINKASKNQIKYEDFGIIELEYNRNKKNTIKFTPLLIEGVDENGQLRGANDVEIDDSDSDFDALDDNNNFKSLVISFAQTKHDERRDIEIKDKSKGSVIDIYSLLYNAADSSFGEIQNWIAETFSITHDKDELAKKEKDKIVINKAFELMSQIIGETLLLGDIETQKNTFPLVKTPDSPEGIPLDLVSQGYENLIGWVGFLMKRLSEVEHENTDFTQRPAICLIDEIDTYLHPKWQSKILSVLITAFPNVQFIVTTHSPYVVGSIPNDTVSIYICKKENNINEVELFDDFTAYGANISRLSRKLFETPIRVDSIEAIIEHLNNIIGENNVEIIKQDIEAIIKTKKLPQFENYVTKLGDSIINIDFLDLAQQAIDELKTITSYNDEDLLSLDSFIRTKRRLKNRRQNEVYS